MPADTEFIGLHIDLYEGRRAQLETVAAASIAYAGLVREISFLLDPSMEIRVELLSGTEGSLHLNTLLKAVQKTGSTRLGAVALAVVGFLAADVAHYALDAGLDLVKEEIKRNLSGEEVKKVTEILSPNTKPQVASQNLQKIYGELEKDPAISGFGATDRPDGRPIFIVPREQFARLSAPIGQQEAELAKREQTITQLVTLVSPILLPGNRKWKFRTDQIEFSAPILDQKFLDGVLSGRRRIAMRAGIQMLVKLKIEETKKGGVWVITDRKIMSVIRISKQPLQTTLDFSSHNNDEADD